MSKTKLIINLFAGPGAGKSTGAAWIFSRLKAKGIDAEYVTEFAKDKVWEDNKAAFKCQFYITGKQAFRISRCFDKVEVIITDSPIALGAMYTEDEPLKAAAVYEFNKYKMYNFNIFLKRTKEYNPNGRNQTESESKEIDILTKEFLNKNDIAFEEYDASPEGYDALVERVLSLLGKN